MFWSRKKVDFSEILNRHVDGDFALCACCEDAPSESVIRTFEKKIGYRLPDLFRDFSKSPLGGLYIEVKEEFWPRAKAYDVGPFWSFLYGAIVFGFAHDVPEWMDMQKIHEEFQRETESGFTPFMKLVGDADMYCFDRAQKIFRWSHDTGEFEPVNKDFFDLLDYEIGQLRLRKDRKKQEIEVR